MSINETDTSMFVSSVRTSMVSLYNTSMEHHDKPVVKPISPEKAQHLVHGKKFIVRAVPATDDDGYRIGYEQHVIIVNDHEEPVLGEEPIVLDTKAYHLKISQRKVYDQLRHTVCEIKKEFRTILEVSNFRPNVLEAFFHAKIAWLLGTEPMRFGEAEEMNSLIKTIEQEITRIEHDTMSQLYAVVLQKRERPDMLEHIIDQILEDEKRMSAWIRQTSDYVHEALWAIPGRKFPA